VQLKIVNDSWVGLENRNAYRMVCMHTRVGLWFNMGVYVCILSVVTHACECVNVDMGVYTCVYRECVYAYISVCRYMVLCVHILQLCVCTVRTLQEKVNDIIQAYGVTQVHVFVFMYGLNYGCDTNQATGVATVRTGCCSQKKEVPTHWYVPVHLLFNDFLSVCRHF